MRFKISGCATLGEAISNSLVVGGGADWRHSAVGRAVDAVGYSTPRSDIDGTVDERSVVNGSCHCIFKTEENNQCCIKHGGRRE